MAAAVSKLRGAAAAGLDDVPPDLVKVVAPVLAEKMAPLAVKPVAHGVPARRRGSRVLHVHTLPH